MLARLAEQRLSGNDDFGDGVTIWEAHTKAYATRQLEAPRERLRGESRDKDEAPLFQANAEKKHSER